MIRPSMPVRLLLSLLAVLPAVVSARAAGERDDSWEKYRLLVDRNIFLRYRRRRTTYRPPTTRPAPRRPRDSDQDIVLTGIGNRDGQTVAFFEDTVSEATVRARAGEAVGRGRIRSIWLDGVEYERDGRTTRIEVGRTLQGARFVVERPVRPAPAARPAPGAAGSAGQSAEPTTGPATAPAGDAGDDKSVATPAPEPVKPKSDDSDVADILKRMRERRERELRR